MRLCSYTGGNGLLRIESDSLLFVADSQSPFADELELAAAEESPGRALATVLTSSEFQVPPFIFASESDQLRGIVYGQMRVKVFGTDAAIVDGSVSDPWAMFAVDPSCTLTYGADDFAWDDNIEAGVVAAGGFQWARETGGPAVMRPGVGHGSGDALREELQPIRPDVSFGDEMARVEEDATIVLGAGQVLLEGLHAERRMIEALVCLECEMPNPPARERCRSCTSLLVGGSTDLRRVPQPVLGTICLSDGREEVLDCDLIIGRRPNFRPVEKHQRAVTHAEHDRSVSRRHIELRLDHWRVIAENLQDAPGTRVLGRDGRRRELVTGEPQTLTAGDTIYFGGAWLRYEPEG